MDSEHQILQRGSRKTVDNYKPRKKFMRLYTAVHKSGYCSIPISAPIGLFSQSLSHIVFSGLASHTTVINSTYFITNNRDGPGGGIHIGYVEGPYLFASSLKMDSSVFKKNSADFGGAIHVLTNRK